MCGYFDILHSIPYLFFFLNVSDLESSNTFVLTHEWIMNCSPSHF